MPAECAYGLLARRIAAYLTDMLLLFAVLAPAGFLAQWALGYRPETGPEIWGFLLVTFSLPVWLYFWLFESVTGATPGKRLAGLRVCRTGDGPPGLVRSLVRTIGKLLPWELVHFSAFGLSRSPEVLAPIQIAGLALAWLLIGVWLLAVARTRGRAGIHDRIAGTRVARRDADGSGNPNDPGGAGNARPRVS